MQPYLELNAHHIGKSHVQGGLSCEDYSATYSDDQVSIIVISDGHGDRNCFRSDRGARYACEIGISLCRQFQSITNHIDDIEQCDFESLIVSLESDIAEAWKEKVLSDASIHPFSEEELITASVQAQSVYRTGQKLEKAYGCTMILAMSTDNYWITVQIGDGKSVAAYKDGVFIEPIPTDENCVGNRSTSLCNSNAKESFRHYYSKVKPVAAFVSSDGVEESFDQAGLYNFFYSVAYWLKEDGFDVAKKKLEELLPQISEGGSGDDVSAAIMVSTADTITKPRQTLEQIYERVNACKNTFEQCKNLLADTKDRMEEKEKEHSAISKEISQLKAELEEKEKVHSKLISELDLLKNAKVELETKSQRASEQMEKATKYKAAAERYWFAEFNKIGLKYPFTSEESKESAAIDDMPDHEKGDQDGVSNSRINIALGANQQTFAPVIIKRETHENIIEQENDADKAVLSETGSIVACVDANGAMAYDHPIAVSQQKDDEKHFW